MLVGIAGEALAQHPVPGAEWERFPSPAAAGWDSARLRTAFTYADSVGTAALVLVQDGRIVPSWGDIARRRHVFSIRKSFQSALIGLEIADRRVRRESTLADLGIDDTEPSLTPGEKAATVRDLLMARSGIYHPAAYETPGMASRRPERGSHAPGSFWYYNNWDFNALATISEQVAGRGLFQEFDERIARPVGMQDFRVGDGEMVRESVSVHPAAVFRMSARDLARFGLLYLDQGRWGSRQVIPADWVHESTQPYSDLGILGGYGYLWWVALHGEHYPFVSLPDGTFSARGTGEQNLLVVPAWRLVLVHVTDVEALRAGDPSWQQHLMRVTQFGRLLRRVLAARSPGAAP